MKPLDSPQRFSTFLHRYASHRYMRLKSRTVIGRSSLRLGGAHMYQLRPLVSSIDLNGGNILRHHLEPFVP
jgi:hypothetical protein